MNKATERLKEIEEFLHSDFCIECSQTMEKSEHYCEHCNNSIAVPFTFSDIAINKIISSIHIIIEQTKKEYEQKIEEIMELKREFAHLYNLNEQKIQQLLLQKGKATKEQIKGIIKKHDKELLEKLKPKKLKVAVNTPMLMLKAGEYYRARDVEEVLK